MKGLIISRIEALRGGASGFGFAACAAICVFALGLTGCEFIRDFMGIGGEEPPQPAMVSGPAIRIDSPDPEGGPGWSFDDNTVTIAKNGVYTIQGGTTVNRVKVSSGVKANIVLDGVDIDLSAGSADECAFDITGAAVELIFALGSTNTLKSNGTSAGLHVPAGAALTITSAAGGGTLSAAGGNSGGAGIGGGNGEDGGTITISGGTVNATGGTGGAGIGGGKGDNSGSPTIVGGGGGNITISGGTVSATGGDGEGDVKHANYHQPGTGTSGGSGIGGGSFGPGGTITIRGGFVWAYSPASSGDSPTPAGPSPGDTDDPNGDPPAIGGGSVSGSDGDAGTITISGGTVIAVTESRGAAIGGGKRAKNGSITISGGTIIALYRPGLGPYGGTTHTQSGYDESNDGTIGLDSDPFDAEHGYTTTTVSGQPVIFAYGIQKTVNNGKGGHNRDGSNPGNGITVQPIHVLMTINDEHPTPASGGTIELKSFPIISNTDSLPSALEDANLNAYNLVIPSGATLHIPKGWTLIIDGGNDTKHNTLTNYGTIINDGAITVGSGTFYPDPGNFINRGILN